MNERRSPSAISKTRSGQSATGVTPTPPRRDAPLIDMPDVRAARGRPWVVLAGLVFVGVLSGVGVWILWNAGAFGCIGAPSAPADGDWSKAPMNDDERLAAEFVRLKNAGDPAAGQLLGRSPDVPAEAVSREKADRLQTDFFLRQKLRIVRTRRGGSPGTLVLSTDGAVSAPRLQVQEGGAVSTEARAMFSPDLTIEVRDGKIFGVRCDLGG